MKSGTDLGDCGGVSYYYITTVPAPAHPITDVTNIMSDAWAVSGDLLLWESALVYSAKSEIIASDAFQEDSAKVICPPKAFPW